MKTERPQPYIGISGIVESAPHQSNMQYWLMDQFIWHGLDADDAPHRRLLALGVKAVHKTQYLDVENKYGREWYPVGEAEFAGALDSGGMPALRVAQVYLDVEHVDDPAYRDAFVQRICRRGKAWLNALQFDLLPWQRDDSMLPFLERIKVDTGHQILLQAHGDAMSQLGSEGVARRLGRYAQVLDYVLFDASHGKGVRMDTAALRPFLDEAYDSPALSHIGFGVAGGLNAEVVRAELPTLLADHPDLSWDAEGQLHPMDRHGKRPLDAGAAKAYIAASADVLKAQREV